MAFEIRFLPGDDPASLLDRLRAAGARLAGEEVARGRTASVEIVEENEYPGVDTGADCAIVVLACTASGNFSTYKAGFGSEAGLFTKTLGLEAVVCGPGSIDRAHKPDEFVTGEELAGCDAFLARVVAAVC